MRIGIDYTAAVRQRAGIGRYTRNLVRAVADLDRQNQYTLFVAGGWGQGDGCGPWPDNVRVRSFPLTDRWLHILWQRLRLPLPVQIATGPLDVFHSPDFVLPPTGKTPALVTVHDLSFLRVPHCFVPGFSDYLRRAVARAVRRARLILADSESTRRDLIELMAADPGRVQVLYPGVEPRFRVVHQAEALKRARDRYHLPERFILGLGTLQPRKNYVGLVEAFRCLVATRGDDPGVAGVKLVIAGESGWFAEENRRAVEKAGLEEQVQFLGFVDDADLPLLYNLATVFAFPSWYEGFGLPVLEAMACGVPVVAADNSSLPEVVGDGGILVDASDVGALAAALGRLLTEDELRARVIAGARKQVPRFSWEASARRLIEIYGSFA